MSDLRQPLESQQSFSIYCERVKQQLQTHVVERIAFLESAFADLCSLEALARNAANTALVAELQEVGRQLNKEINLLRNMQHGDADKDAQPLQVQSDLRAMESSVYGQSTMYSDPRGTQRTPMQMRQMAPPVPKLPMRPLDEIYQDVDSLVQEAEKEESLVGTAGLVRLKGLLCRQRALQAELAVHDIQHWPLRQLLNYLRRRVDDEHGPGHYLIPLRAELWPTDAWPWYMLADLYDRLAAAYEAMDWYESESEKLTQSERQELLESIASHQTRLWRHLQLYYPRQNDEHQINLFRDLCAIAEEEDIYLISLQERCPDDTLTERAESMPLLLEQLRLDKNNRSKREATLQSLRLLVTDPDFGTRESDVQSLNEAVSKCLAEGMPASSLALNNLLSDWVAPLAESSDKTIQEVVRELTLESNRKLVRSTDSLLAEVEKPLSESEQAEMNAVKELVKDRKVLFIGGTCREENRTKLERELGLSELVWTSSDGTESMAIYDKDIQNTDITVFLTKFMKTGWRQARDLAVKHDKMFVRLPAGFGINQVARQFYRQLIQDIPNGNTK